MVICDICDGSKESYKQCQKEKKDEEKKKKNDNYFKDLLRKYGRNN